MESEFISDLERALSPARLSRYTLNSTTDLDTAANYFWNMSLCEALYPSLDSLEISLRNSIHFAATSYFAQNEFWFDLPGILKKRQPSQVQRARNNLASQGKPHTAGRIVAELSFGFWTTLLSDPYHSSLWMLNKAYILKEAFPHMKNTQRIRSEIHRRYDLLRILRNRVFHFEPVWRGISIPNTAGDFLDVFDVHAAAVEAIGWTNTTLQASTMAIDRFDDVYRHGRSYILEAIRHQFKR